MASIAEPAVVFHLGPVAVTHSVVVTWAVMLVLAVASWIGTRNLGIDPSPGQVVFEGVIEAIQEAIREVIGVHADRVFGFVATLWIFILTANLSGLIPGVDAPTGDLSTTAALAALVFLSVHWFGIRSEGVKAYLRHYLAPIPLMLPFHLISEVTRTLALAVRLFGNIMSLEMAALLVLLVGGALVPIPLLMLHIVEAVVQAYIFGMLALIYIASALQFQMIKQEKRKVAHA